MAASTKSAEQAIAERFQNIEAALDDIRPAAFGVQKRRFLDRDSSFARRYQNRLMELFHLVSHIRDDCKRLAKRKGLESRIVDDFARKSVPVAICVRASDTRKHGFGGRTRNATTTNGLILVQKTVKGAKPSPEDDCLVIGMAVVDAEFGPFHSSVVVGAAIRDWVDFLAVRLGLDFKAWLEKCLPRSARPVVKIGHGESPVVPEGATLVCEFPGQLALALVRDVRNRCDEA